MMVLYTIIAHSFLSYAWSSKDGKKAVSGTDTIGHLGLAVGR